ncbi:Protein detoxification 46, chloroplastic [Vitis vinifera]|uniref:Protein detoxification 46, chloroplastic n=1 Tax=Vitis vinifera TaxID=29760 RepID=A0A438I9D3_VITVI|nr:Protein detoxification 46, chloroplastic [Vitis vinifera]
MQDKNEVQHQISTLLFVGFTCGVLMLLFTKFLGAWALTGNQDSFRIELFSVWAYVLLHYFYEFLRGQRMLILYLRQMYMFRLCAFGTAIYGKPLVHPWRWIRLELGLILPLFLAQDILIRGLAWPAVLVGWVAQSASLGMKDSWGPLKALAVASAINGIGDIVLCSFLGYGIAGAAWATMVSQVIAGYMMIEALNKKGYNAFAFSVPSLDEFVQILGLAAPVFVTMMSKVAFYSFLIYFATSMGTHTLAAHQVMSQLYSMCTVWGEPLSQTAQSFMPELIYGVNRNLAKARMLLKSLLIMGALVGLTLGTIAIAIPWLFPNIFTHDGEVIHEVSSVPSSPPLPSLIPAKSFWPYLNPIISLSLSHSGHQSLFSEPREKTLSSQSNSRQKTLTAGNFSGELFRRIFPANFPATVFFYTARSAWRRSPICPKAPEPETHPRAAHARFSGRRLHLTRRRLHLTRRRVRAREPLSGDALPPPGSPDADQPPFLPVCAIRALHVPLLGLFCFRGPSDQIFRRPSAIFSQLQSLHVP